MVNNKKIEEQGTVLNPSHQQLTKHLVSIKSLFDEPYYQTKIEDFSVFYNK